MHIRRQLSLFVPPPMGAQLDQCRANLDPVQASLIAAHVTLCRDDELLEMTSIVDRLHQLSRNAHKGIVPLSLGFGAARRGEGHGIFLDCIDGESMYQRLRRFLLLPLSAPLAAPLQVRRMAPHITLAHPRNPCTEANRSLDFSTLPQYFSIEFSKIAWIEQHPNCAWQVLQEFQLSLFDLVYLNKKR